MKRIIASLMLTIGAVLSLTAAGYSQQPILRAEIPFEFSVGQQTFPAGEYVVVEVTDRVLSLRDSKGGFLFSVTPEVLFKGGSTAKLRFERVGGQYVLSQIWPGRTSERYDLSMPKRYHGSAQEHAGTEVLAFVSVTERK